MEDTFEYVTIDYTHELNDINESIVALNNDIIEMNLKHDEEISVLKSINTLLLFICIVLLYLAFKEKVTKWIR